MRIFLMSAIILSFTALVAQEPIKRFPNDQSNPKTLPVLWQQTSAEYRALCYQAFNLATLRINQIPEKELKKGDLAIITDLDETILDNSHREAQLILDHQTHSASNWKEWSDLHIATGVPGAVEFLNAAHEKGISVFYISNRDTSEINSTLENMKSLMIPDADTEHMLFLSTYSSKETRRHKVMENYQVIMLLGDNLNDFTSSFEKKSIAERKNETDNLKDEWGKKFIVLPNSTYGEWENALYKYKHNLNPEVKDSIRISLLRGYKVK
jgi:5'-nucleotidase (lipoprotein e(P4) family)